MGELKKCKMCGEEFPRTQEYFHKNKRAKDGLQYHCKECANKIAKQHRNKNNQSHTLDSEADKNNNLALSFSLFNSSEFGNVRFIKKNNKPYAVGVDVARALGYTYPSQAVGDHCKGIVKTPIPSTNQHGATVMQKTNVIPEGDIYRLVVKAADQSRNLEIKEKAERFESWIFDEVIPQIRVTGGYIPVAKEDDEMTIMAKAVLISQKTIETQTELIGNLRQKISEDEPKVLFANQLAKTKEMSPVGNYAKTLCHGGFKIGQNILFRWLRDNKILMKDNIPYQQYIVNGAFEVNRYVEFKDGEYKQRSQTLITPKGQLYLFKKMLKDPDLGLAS